MWALLFLILYLYSLKKNNVCLRKWIKFNDKIRLNKLLRLDRKDKPKCWHGNPYPEDQECFCIIPLLSVVTVFHGNTCGRSLHSCVLQPMIVTGIIRNSYQTLEGLDLEDVRNLFPFVLVLSFPFCPFHVTWSAHIPMTHPSVTSREGPVEEDASVRVKAKTRDASSPWAKIQVQNRLFVCVVYGNKLH